MLQRKERLNEELIRWQTTDNLDNLLLHCSQMIELDSTYIRAYIIRSFVYIEKENEKQANIDYQKAYQLKLKQNANFNEKDFLSAIREDVILSPTAKQAIWMCTRIIALDEETHFGAYFSRAAAWFERGQIDLSILDLEKCQELDSDYRDALYEKVYAARAQKYYKNNQFNEALLDCEKGMALLENAYGYEDCVTLQLRIYYQMGDKKSIARLCSQYGHENRNVFGGREKALPILIYKHFLENNIATLLDDEYVFTHACNYLSEIERNIFIGPYLDRANQRLQDKDYPGAIHDYKQAILLNPKLPPEMCGDLHRLAETKYTESLRSKLVSTTSSNNDKMEYYEKLKESDVTLSGNEIQQIVIASAKIYLDKLDSKFVQMIKKDQPVRLGLDLFGLNIPDILFDNMKIFSEFCEGIRDPEERSYYCLLHAGSLDNGKIALLPIADILFKNKAYQAAITYYDYAIRRAYSFTKEQYLNYAAALMTKQFYSGHKVGDLFEKAVALGATLTEEQNTFVALYYDSLGDEAVYDAFFPDENALNKAQFAAAHYEKALQYLPGSQDLCLKLNKTKQKIYGMQAHLDRYGLSVGGMSSAILHYTKAIDMNLPESDYTKHVKTELSDLLNTTRLTKELVFEVIKKLPLPDQVRILEKCAVLVKGNPLSEYFWKPRNALLDKVFVTGPGMKPGIFGKESVVSQIVTYFNDIRLKMKTETPTNSNCNN